MLRSLKNILIPIGILILIGFALFMINQISGIYLVLTDINPLLARIVLAGLILITGGLALSPLYLYFRLPRPLTKPKKEEDVSAYQKNLVRRLGSNELLKKEKLLPQSERDLPESVESLDKKADQIIRNTATTVFLTTSVSQNGKLDAVTVFSTQMRMIWKIAHVYYQRPTLREMISVYGHVGLNAFVASEIEDLDISQQIEPVASALFRNASSKSVPLIGPTANIILDSLMEGSTNAFLTLRVGILAKKYCGHLGVWKPGEVKKSAFKEAAIQLRNIALSSSGRIISGIIAATKNAGLDTLRSGWEGMKKTSGKVKDRIVDTSQKINPFRKKEEREKLE